MVKKVFITDCEGPLTLNDNAYELADEFIEDGGKLFKIISRFDDYLVDDVKLENYHAGDTLKLIVPFYKLAGLTNEKMIKFSRENIYLVDGSDDTLRFANELIDSFIVSTSYGQYIEALSNYMEFPFENTYYTKVDVDALSLNEDELSKIAQFKVQILVHFLNLEILRVRCSIGTHNAVKAGG